MNHLIIAPVIVPLLAGAAALALHRRPAAGLAINLGSTILLLAIAVALLLVPPAAATACTRSATGRRLSASFWCRIAWPR